LGLFDQAFPLQKEMDRMGQLTAAYEGQFRLPDVKGLAELVRQFDAISARPILQQTHDFLAVQKAMESMKSPWLRHN
jgi:hypothetical protein